MKTSHGPGLRTTDLPHLTFFFILTGITLLLAIEHPLFGLLAVGNVVLGGLVFFVSKVVFPHLNPRGIAIGQFIQCTTLIPIAYAELSVIIPVMNSNRYGPSLRDLDLALFGFDVQTGLLALEHPALTEIMQLVYLSLYVVPSILYFRFRKENRFTRTDRLALVTALSFYVCYLFYFMIPAESPGRVYDFPTPLEGLFWFEPIRTLIANLEVLTLDCFPSGHVLVAATWTYHSAREDSRLLRYLLPWFGAICFSTVYLRYHYLIDLVFVLVLIPLILGAVEWIYARPLKCSSSPRS